jgi:response regulator RpfG family c-di-GMP phosphodiesterase
MASRKSKSKADKAKSWGLLISFFLILIPLIFYAFYCRSYNHCKRTLSYEGENITQSQDGILFTHDDPSRVWSLSETDEIFRGKPYGGSYYFYLTNENSLPLTDWKATITFDGDFSIGDVFPTGSMEKMGNSVIFTPTADPESENNPSYLESGKVQQFGANLYSEDPVVHVTKYVLEYHLAVDFWKTGVSISLLALLGVWFLLLIVYLTFRQKEQEFQKSQETEQKVLLQSVMTFTNFIDAKDPYTEGHSARVAIYSKALGKELGMKDSDIQNLYLSALLHDCGKIGISNEVLEKPGKLTDAEYKTIQGHTTIGATVLKDITSIPGVQDGAHYHHERYDGKGYPCHLRGEQIPYFARIICVADCYDAMTTDRCYRKKLTRDAALKEIEKNEGTQFDPSIASAMVKMIQDGSLDKALYSSQGARNPGL